MKTKQLISALLILFFISTTQQSFSQNLFETDFSTSEFKISSETVDIRNYEIDVDDFNLDYDISEAPKSITESDAQDNAVAFALNMIAFGVGFGFTDLETLWCLHAAYYLRLAMLGNKALYASAGVGYNGISGDFITSSILDVSLKVLMFSLLAKRFQQVRAQYGVFAKYAFGSIDFENGYKNDITRLSLGILVGLHILLSPQWSLMVQTNLLTYQEQTTELEDNSEIKDSQTFGLINKNNLLLLSLVFTLPSRNRNR
ncbi:hypothetical protein [uncultured Psychroserpens sp.]|uniref:hypothetical protein n=1 Tax=uncultured Psychroserpens sp. TaxID=255436 RepID=UPI002630D020|nr:hypothetical protein [uncultured Psychroserpens sp.]